MPKPAAASKKPPGICILVGYVRGGGGQGKGEDTWLCNTPSKPSPTRTQVISLLGVVWSILAKKPLQSVTGGSVTGTHQSLAARPHEASSYMSCTCTAQHKHYVMHVL
jgi:hypothetical protein